MVELVRQKCSEKESNGSGEEENHQKMNINNQGIFVN